MVHLLRGDGLYPFLEEFAGLRPECIRDPTFILFVSVLRGGWRRLV